MKREHLVSKVSMHLMHMKLSDGLCGDLIYA